MELWTSLGRHPWLAAAALALMALLAYALVKRLLKFALLVLLALVAVVAWFKFTGRELPANVDQLARHAGKAAHQAVVRTDDLIRKGERELEAPDSSGKSDKPGWTGEDAD